MHGLVRGFCLVEHDAERHVERLLAEAREVVVQLLDARLVADGRVRIRRAGRRLGRILAALAVDVIEMLGLACSTARGRRRRSARPARCRLVAELAEVLSPQAEQRRAVELGVAADVVVRVRVQRLAVPVAPQLLGVVLRLAR